MVTPPSLRNLSLEEETNEPEHEATSWEANVARNLETLPRSSSPYPRKTSTLEDLELDTDDNMVDIQTFLKDLLIIKGLLDLNKLTRFKDIAPHLKTVPQMYNEFHTSSSTCQAPQKRNLGDSPGQEKGTPWMASMS